MSARVGIIGATGYAGLELVRLLLTHPDVTLAAVSSVSYEGSPISEVYPQLTGIFDMVLVGESELISACDVVFASLPAGISEPIARRCFAAGRLFIDMGADFRLSSEATYRQWYGGEYADPELHRAAVYSIPELHRERIAGTGVRIIANPGCYPTSIALGLAPAIKAGMIALDTLVIDAKSGATGAGRGLALNTHFPECNETFAPYKIASHRHTPEIEQTLTELSGQETRVTFVPHLLPINRGIVSTMYASVCDGFSEQTLRESYAEFYRDEPFVKVLPLGMVAAVKNVRCSNLCHISLHFDARTKRLIVVSVIDNMVKGAAGQAIQNMNIALGFAETSGLLMIPTAF